VEVNGQRLRARNFVIATGSRAVIPKINGIDKVPYFTNETIFDELKEKPESMIVLGGGPIGCEMAQAFARFGSTVTIFGRSPQLLPREDADAAAFVEAALRVDGTELVLGVRLLEVTRSAGTGAYCLRLETGTGIRASECDQILVAAGRTPNVEQLDLSAAHVSYTKQGVTVDDRLRTSNHRIYAAGDVCAIFKFTHAADAMARIAIQNALFFGRRRASALVIPWCTYTDPEIAHVGLYEEQARSFGHRVETITIDLADVDRAVVDDESAGFVRVHHEAGRLLGCTIVASHAGEMIGEAVYALAHGGRLSDLSATIHPYPTQAEAMKKAGDAYRRASLTPAIRRWFQRYFTWTR